MIIVCAQCGNKCDRKTGDVNRAKAQGLNIYCNRICAGIARRSGRTPEQKRTDKAVYDAEYRKKNHEKLKAEKAAWYKANADRDKEREYRQKNMARHIAYCRRPEYKQYKIAYDKKRQEKNFGEFGEAWRVLQEIERTIRSRVTRTDIYRANGTQMYRSK